MACSGVPGNGVWSQDDGLPPNFLPDQLLDFDLGAMGSQDLAMGDDTHLPDNFDFWQDCLSSIEPSGPQTSNSRSSNDGQ